MAKPITDKQKRAINNVEVILQKKFDGFTRQDAFLWLRENMPLAVNRVAKQIIGTTEQYRPYDNRMDFLNKEVNDLTYDSSGEMLTEMQINAYKEILGM